MTNTGGVYAKIDQMLNVVVIEIVRVFTQLIV